MFCPRSHHHFESHIHLSILLLLRSQNDSESTPLVEEEEDACEHTITTKRKSIDGIRDTVRPGTVSKNTKILDYRNWPRSVQDITSKMADFNQPYGRYADYGNSYLVQQPTIVSGIPNIQYYTHSIEVRYAVIHFFELRHLTELSCRFLNLNMRNETRQ